MKKRFIASYDDLIANRYGASGKDRLRDLSRVDELLAGYYGRPVSRPRRSERRLGMAVSLSHDDGEMLPQRAGGNGGAGFEEYVVERAGVALQASHLEEYVVERAGLALGASHDGGGPARYAQDVSAAQEREQDLLRPLDEGCSACDEAASPTKPAASPTKPAMTPAPAALAAGAALYPTQPASPATARAASLPTAGASQAGGDDTQFEEDLKAILSGQKVFDPVSKKTVEKGELAPSAQSPSDPNDRPAAANAPPGNGQAIFDRIAQSMQYANSFDLGTFDLEQRFSDFDRAADSAAQAPAQKRRQAGGQRPATGQSIGSAEFLRDLDAIHRQEAAPAPALGQAPAQAASVTNAGDYSRPFYDTGEHVRTGGGQYEGRLRVGQNPGVGFSYGEIISMADLYESVDLMMAADVNELKRLKALIERSTAYYTPGKRGSVQDVDSEEWEKATGGRYLKLATDNYEHFAPNTLFKGAAVTKAGLVEGDHRSAWEASHRRAIQAAQKMLIAPENAARSVFLEWPLIINAFGDHFLTDAFAAGHVINKEVMIRLFKQNFYNGQNLKPEAKEFLKKLAQAAFKGNVARKFSTLETVDYPVCKWGWCIKWRPNIDSDSRFADLLIAAAEQEPDRVGNFVVKALHDRLNNEGLEVTNAAGAGTWRLTGDTTLNDKNLAIIQKAVQASIDNINDPAILASNLDFGAFFARVWKHTPQLTTASRQYVERLMKDYTSPTSAELVKAAAEIIGKEVDSLVKTLIAEKKLKPA